MDVYVHVIHTSNGDSIVKPHDACTHRFMNVFSFGRKSSRSFELRFLHAFCWWWVVSAHHRIIQHATQPGKEICARPQARQDKIKTIRTLIFTADDAADRQWTLEIQDRCWHSGTQLIYTLIIIIITTNKLGSDHRVLREHPQTVSLLKQQNHYRIYVMKLFM